MRPGKLTFLLWASKRKLIAVGLPVTRQPPHRSRRAIFSHRDPDTTKKCLQRTRRERASLLSGLGSSLKPEAFGGTINFSRGFELVGVRMATRFLKCV
jgi:hypothetical protein